MKDAIQHAAEMLTQDFPIQTIDQEARTVVVVFSTGALIPHLVHINGLPKRMLTRVVVTDEAMDAEFLKAGAPVLNSHNTSSVTDVLGSVQDVWIENGSAMARLRFSQADDVAPIWQRVVDSSVHNVSMGFEVLANEVRQEVGFDGQTIDVMYFTRWRPKEISLVINPADKGARTQGEQPAPDALSTGGDAILTAEQETKMTAENTPPVDAESIVQAERARIAGIHKVAGQLGVADDLVQSAIADDVCLDKFRADAVDAFVQKGQEATAGIGGPRATVTMDATDKFRQGAELGLLAKAGLGGERNEFTSMTLAEMARHSLALQNRTDFRDRREMVGAAFVQAGAHSTSDFAEVLSNVAQKAALKGWEEAEETYQLWTSMGTLSDFRPAKRVGLGLIDALPLKAEGADYTYGTVGERGENITLATYGRLIKITREAIINDDLALFASVPVRMGRAARRTIGDLVYAVLTSNPNMSDGTALFHADHGNLASSGSALSVASLGAARAAMRIQKEASGGSALNITPRHLIVPAALETAAQQLMESTVDPTASKGHAANPVANMAQVITDARLDAASTTAWFMAANAQAFDTIEVAYLDGIQEPYIEEKTAWSSDGVELKVRIDAGVAPLDYRTLYKNAGA